MLIKAETIIDKNIENKGETIMSEQTLQNELYSKPVTILDKYTCWSLGATTVKDLVDSGKIIGVSASVNVGKKPDVLIVDKDKRVVVFIEFKKPSEFNTDKKIKAAIEQELDVAIKVGAKIYVVTDGTKFIWINPKTKKRLIDENGNEIFKEIKPKVEEKKLGDFISRVALDITDTNNQLVQISDMDPSDLAEKIAGILQNINFTTPKDSLYTFVELFLFKYLSDIGLLVGRDSFDTIYKMYESNASEEEVLYCYLTDPREKIKLLFPEASDKTSIINGTIFHASKTPTGYICNGTDAITFHEVIKLFAEYERKNGKFLHISRDFKSKLFETFTKKERNKQNAGKYFTPLKIVQGMVDMVDIMQGMIICDPACGVGKFLLEASLKLENPFEYKNQHIIKNIVLHGYEKELDEKGATTGYDLTTILAKANMLIYFSNLFKENNNVHDIQVISNELLNDTFFSSKTVCGTLDKINEEKYDLILANPPYYSSKIICDAARKTNLYSKNGAGVEGLFVEWIIKSLKKGGIANIILPDGIFNNIRNGDLKEYIKQQCYIETIISLPINTFINTPKKTYILTLKKKVNTEEVQSYPIFCYICKSIGETLDVNRFDVPEDNDFRDAVNRYNIYRKLTDKTKIEEPFKSWFDNDKKLKFINIDEFIPDKSWIIEKHWTQEEKIAIGLVKESNTVSVEELQEFISEITEQMNEYKEVLECLK